MNSLLQPWQLYLFYFAGWVNRQQQEIIEYLRTENQVLMEKLGKKRILLSDDQRRKLAVKGKVLGRKILNQIGTLFTPDTILRWHRQLIARKWDFSRQRKNRVGRPRVRQVIIDLVLRFAKENTSWGYDRIQGALANVGYHICDTTVGNILKANGVDRAPERRRQTSWRVFLKSHWDVLAAVDFTSVEVWTKRGLVTFYLLFVIELKSRRVHFAGCAVKPNDEFMKQVARELTNSFDGFLKPGEYLIMDRDTKFSEAFRHFLIREDITPIQLPPRSPNLNAHLERFMRSIKNECLSRMIFFGEKSLRNAVTQYLEHYHHERNHQGLDNQIIETQESTATPNMTQPIQRRERLGGLLNYYHRAAA